jgi:hypothetical protein
MSRPDEGLIHQWLDGECTPEESARLEQLVATDAEWAAAVAEARGLIAASSRIVGALDAVPRAMPKGSTAAPGLRGGGSSSPTPVRSPMRRVPAWIGLAATVAIVAGTAYVLREQSTAPFGTVSMPAPAPPSALDTAPGVQVARDARQLEPPADVPSLDATVPSGAGAGRMSSGAATAAAPAAVEPPAAAAPSANTPPPIAAAPRPSPARVADASDVTAAEQRKAAEATTARRDEELRAEQERARASESRRVMRAADAPRGAIARTAEPAAAMAGASAVLPRLEGCWRVTAPPELAGLLEAPSIRRTAGDTLVLVTARGDVAVIREGDTLRGGLQAKAEPCRVPE